MNNSKPRIPVAASERDKINRNILVWLNQFPELPENIFRDMITPESYLRPDIPGMAMVPATNAYISKSYILGGHEAEYDFAVIYRIKPGNSLDKSLKANELLNRLGDWASQNKPDLGEGIRVVDVAPTSQAELYAPYNVVHKNGDEDHRITMRIVYEVT